MDHNELRGLLSDEHFSVDGTQIAAWASMKSFRAKDGSGDPPGAGRKGERDFHGEKRSNATHASTTDPEAQLYRKGRGKEAKLSFMGHTLMENRSGLIVAATLTQATGTAERKAAEEMIVRHSPGARRITLGADSRLTDEAVVLRRLGHSEGDRLRADLPRMRCTQVLSSVSEWQPAHLGDQGPENPSQCMSDDRWYRIETSCSP